MTTPVNHGENTGDSLAAAKWLPVRPKPEAALRVFAFPYAGGGPTLFRGWDDYFAERGLQLCPIAYPGREKRLAEPFAATMDELVDGVMLSAGTYFDQPYALLGLCFGGCVAFEVARRATEAGFPPAGLIACGARAPHTPAPVAARDMPHEEFVAMLGRFRFVPDIVLQTPDLLNLFIPFLRADFAMDELFLAAASQKLPFPITSFYGKDDAVTPKEQALAWDAYTSAEFRVHEFAGDQLFFITQFRKFMQELLQEAGRFSA